MLATVAPMKGFSSLAEASWLPLALGLEAGGLTAVEFGEARPFGDALIALGHRQDALSAAIDAGIPRSRRALVVLEPEVTAPSMYRSSVVRQYGHIFAASPMWARKLAGESFLWPQDLSFRQTDCAHDDWAATIIVSEKRSAVPGSQYGLRRQVIHRAGLRHQRIVVAGAGWSTGTLKRVLESSRVLTKAASSGVRPVLREAYGGLRVTPVHYLGTIHDKSEALRLSPVSIVIENSLDYVSEKIFDVIRHGVAPFYVGPPLGQFGIPTEVAIICPPRADEVLARIGNLSLGYVDEVVSAGREWILSDRAKGHGTEEVQRRLGQRIAQELSR